MLQYPAELLLRGGVVALGELDLAEPVVGLVEQAALGKLGHELLDRRRRLLVVAFSPPGFRQGKQRLVGAAPGGRGRQRGLEVRNRGVKLAGREGVLTG